MVKEGKVPGHNDAIYDTVPKEDQLLDEIAPTPIIADRVFFVYLRGDLSKSEKKELGLLDKGLIDATLSVSGSVVYPDGSYIEPRSLTMPLKTIPINDAAHLIIRDSNGTQVNYPPSSGRSDILLDFQIPAMFLKSMAVLSQKQKEGRMEMVQLLLEYGADPMRAGGGCALHRALRDIDFSLTTFLADKGARIKVSELTESDQKLLDQAIVDYEWGK
ncbi:uncharacterized protein N7482_010600 [Penicillium canariense]|uniref:Uncharacterized protein n=1 Tax=Penicillium canariense TaxID=189055 RepID=A0A9W9HMB3_9EURO|nr:uncharacterized protein N7482_010600 [Penicillium canariense]KAJ5151348.1 hypothetical protein N7482_010600 [Penicillium canariense]